MVEQNSVIPKPPPLPPMRRRFSKYSCVPKGTEDMWDKVFQEGFGADVYVLAASDGENIVARAHQFILSMASPVLENILKRSKVKDGVRYLRIPGMPPEAIRIFIRFLYSSCYEESEMEEFVLHLLVLSHVYRASVLKKVCEQNLEKGLLTKANVVDVLQLSQLCDAPRLALVCQRMIIKDLRSFSASEAWKVMRYSNPEIEQELLEFIVEVDLRKQQRRKRSEESKVYIQLHQAMEALLHICNDGCRTIGPRDKALKPSPIPCNFPACKGLETLIRHFYDCKKRAPGGCIHCKRMWQLLELHSRMCDESECCKVPLCQHFKEKRKQQTKKQETKWKLLIRKVEAAKIANGLLLSFKCRC